MEDRVTYDHPDCWVLGTVDESDPDFVIVRRRSGRVKKIRRTRVLDIDLAPRPGEA